MWELRPPQEGGKDRRGLGINLTRVFYGHLSEQVPGVEESTGHETLGVDSV